MNRLSSELQRLYTCAHAAAGHAPAHTVTPDGLTRCLVLQLGSPAAWAPVSRLWRALQADLHLPAPAIAIDGANGYQLWLSLQQPVTVEQAHQFLVGLRQRYLPEVPDQRLQLWPQSNPPVYAHAPPVPALQPPQGGGPDGERWSAYVAPDLAPVFEDNPSLDLPPGSDGQADLLSTLKSISPDAWAQALQTLAPLPPVVPAMPSPGPSQPAKPADTPSGGAATTPRQFLQRVMNDDTVDLPLRIEAAKALLPYT